MAVRVRNTTVNGGMSGRDESINKVFAFREGETKSIMKRFTAPAQPNSPEQIAIRNEFTRASASWSLLTDGQRNSWNGETGTGGKENYVATNIVLDKAGLPALSAALPKDQKAILTAVAVILTTGQADLEYTSSSAQPNERVQIEVSKMQSLGTSAFKRGTIIGSYPIVLGSNLVDFQVALENKIGILATGTKVFYSVFHVSQGGGRSRILQGQSLL